MFSGSVTFGCNSLCTPYRHVHESVTRPPTPHPALRLSLLIKQSLQLAGLATIHTFKITLSQWQWSFSSHSGIFHSLWVMKLCLHCLHVSVIYIICIYVFNKTSNELLCSQNWDYKFLKPNEAFSILILLILVIYIPMVNQTSMIKDNETLSILFTHIGITHSHCFSR